MTGIFQGIILPRADTAANLAASNIIPLSGERVRETDTGKWKTGDGVTHYNDLPFDPGYAPTILANWKLSNTVKLRSSLAKAKLGTGYSTHAVVGDSLSSAYTGAAFDFANSWWRRLQRALVADGVPSAGTGRVAITDYAGAPANPTDPRISVSGAWGNYDTAYGSPTAGGSITFTSDVAGTIVDVFYLAAGGPAFTVTIDGTPHTVTPAGGWSRAIDTTTGLPNTTHTVTVTAAPAGAVDSVLLLGFQVRQASGLRFDNFAIKYGIAANNLHNDPGDLGAKALAVDYSSDADVVWIALGANDLATGRTASQIVADITGLRNYWPSADCVLVLEPDTGGAAGHADYVTAMRALAVTLDVPLIDLSLRYGSKDQITAAQLFGADNVHLNTVGQSDWSTVARDGVRSVVGQADGLASVKAAADAAQATANSALPLLDSAANLASSNPVVASGRRARETDSGREKTGDGTTYYNDLPYDADVASGQVAGHELFQKFTKRADSSGVPNIFDSGQPATTVAIGTAAQQYVSGGRLRSTPTGGGTAAGYYTGNLSATAKRVGGKFVFIPHTTKTGVATFAITETQYLTTLPRIGLHLVISPTNWILGYAPNTTGTVTIVASNTFAEPLLVDGVTEYMAEAVVVGTTCYVSLPDGTSQAVSWSAAMAYLGPGVFFEHFYTVANTDNEVAFTEVWADSGAQKAPVVGGLPVWRYAKANTVVASTPVAANTTVNIPNLASGNIVAPPSGKILVRFRWFHLLPNSCDVLAQCAVNGTTSAFVAQFLHKAITGDRELNAEFLITGLTPGGIYAFTPSVQTTAASSIYNWPASGYNAMSRFEPVS